MDERLARTGTTRGSGTNCTVEFPAVRCAGCGGRCGLSVGGSELPLDADLPDGTPVQVVVSPRVFGRRAWGVFGWPLGVVGAASALAEWWRLGDAWVVAVLIAAMLGVVGFRAGLAKPDGVGRSTVRPRTPAVGDSGVRVVLGNL